MSDVRGRNLIPTPRIVESETGLWRSVGGNQLASFSAAPASGAGLNNGMATALGPRDSGTGLSIPLPGEVWTPGTQYRVRLRVLTTAHVGFVAGLAVGSTHEAGHHWGDSGATNTEIASAFGGDYSNGHEIPALPYDYDSDGGIVVPNDEWVTLDFTVSTNSDAVFNNPDTLEELDRDGAPLTFVIVHGDSWIGSDYPRISHVRVHRIDEAGTFGEQYFDGNGYAPTEPGTQDTNYVFDWTGEPWKSPSTVTLPPPLTVDPVEITGTVGEELAPVQLTATKPDGTPVQWNAVSWSATGLPDGLSLEGDTISGTPTTAGTGESQVTGTLVYPYGSGSNTASVPYSIEAPEEPDPEEPDPEEPDPEDPEDPDPWDAYDALAAALAPRCAAYVGRPGDADAIATAQAQLPVVAEYVRGYTRGRGWTGDRPAGPLRVVIVSATARLVTNPEQVQNYTTGDYSERPAVLTGWTLAELGVLRRYRRTQA